jgi:uncharacterized protein (TIGR03083 family)
MKERLGLVAPKPVLTLDLFDETLDRLIELLSELSQEEWGAPTVCEGWSVKDVALHLLGIEVGNISARRDQHRLVWGSSDWDGLVNNVNQWNRLWIDATRRIGAPLLIELIEFCGGKTYKYYRSLDLFQMGNPVSWAGPEPRPVWFDIAREYTERWHHQQHIRDAVDKAGLKEPRYLKPVLDTFVWAMPHAFRNESASMGTTIVLSIIGDSGGQWTLLREKAGWGFFRGATEHPDSEVVLEQDIAWRLFTKGIDQERASGVVRIKGDKRLAEPVFDMVSILV